MNTQVIILAGGKGIRMKSENPKVLTQVKGVSLIKRLLESVTEVCPKPTIIVGHKGDDVISETGNAYRYVWQKEQLGTGHAVLCAKADLEKEPIDNIVVLLGDHPLVTEATIKKLAEVREKENAVIVMGTVTVPNYEGDNAIFWAFGRVIRNSKGDIKGIVELKDASEEQKQIKEVNLSYYCFEPKWLWQNIGSIDNKNAKGEYYLTDLAHIAFSEGQKIVSVAVDPVEGMGANTPEEISIIEKYC